jgi:hypothetical protein
MILLPAAKDLLVVGTLLVARVLRIVMVLLPTAEAPPVARTLLAATAPAVARGEEESCLVALLAATKAVAEEFCLAAVLETTAPMVAVRISGIAQLAVDMSTRLGTIMTRAIL